MTNEPRFWSVLFVGPPGAGKDTQAGLLSEELGLTEIKTSRILQEAFDQASSEDIEIKEQAERKKRGELVDPAFTEKKVLAKIKQIADRGEGIVMSGSPRTLPEAQAELPALEELYGREAVKIINIKVSEEESVKRNQSRRVCQLNSHPFPNFPEYQDLKKCPKDGSPIIVRQDDTPETIKHRYQVYLAETAPILDFLSKRLYKIVEINGEQPIEDVHRDILNQLW